MSEENNSLNNNQQDKQSQDNQETSTEQEIVSKVASTPKQRKLFMTLVIAGGLLASYYIFYYSTKKEDSEKQRVAREIEMKKEELAKSAQPVTTGSNIEMKTKGIKNLTSQSLPEPKAPEPPPPPLPPTPHTPFGSRVTDNNPSVRPLPNTSTSLFKSSRDDEEERKRLAAKMKAKIIVVASGELQASEDGSKDGKDKDKNKEELKRLEGSQAGFLGFGEGQLNQGGIAPTSFAPVRATKMGNIEYLITEGKIIDAVLETGINSDLPGTVRATISRDVYASSGKNILIPQGSSVIGSYQSDIKDGQTRIAVTWKRLIMPDGIDLAIDSPGVDSLGRSGVTGDVNTHFWGKMASAFLVSYVIPMVTNKLAGVNKEQIQVLQNTGSTDSGTSTTGSGTTGTDITNTIDNSGGGSVVVGGTVKAVQMKDSSDKFNKILSDTVKNTFQTKPTITVDQGTKIAIMAQKDLLIPPAVIASRKARIME